MATVDAAPCPVPSCAAVGTLTLDRVFEAKPVGAYSLAGVQLKTTGRFRPVLRCSACGLDHRGEYDPDGRHVTFPPLSTVPA